MLEKNRGKTIVSLTTGADMEKGEIYKVYFEKDGKNRIGFAHAIWSPFIIEPIMKMLGWNLVRRRKNKLWEGWTDIYRRVI